MRARYGIQNEVLLLQKNENRPMDKLTQKQICEQLQSYEDECYSKSGRQIEKINKECPRCCIQIDVVHVNTGLPCAVAAYQHGSILSHINNCKVVILKKIF
jgi:hypothetical protein